jgi:hypothetical protein
VSALIFLLIFLIFFPILIVIKIRCSGLYGMIIVCYISIHFSLIILYSVCLDIVFNSDSQEQRRIRTTKFKV